MVPLFNQVNIAKLVGGVEEGRKERKGGKGEKRGGAGEGKGEERRKGRVIYLLVLLEDVLEKKTPRTTRNDFVAENRLFHRRVL